MATKKNGNGSSTCPKCTNGNGKKVQECTNKRQALSQLKRKKWTTFKFLNEKQREFYKQLEAYTITFCTGPAGTGKSFISIYHALRQLASKENSIDGIILCRPLITVDNEGIGFLPGTLEDKVDPYMMAYWQIIEKLVGKAILHNLVEGGVIKVIPVAFFRGLSIENKVILYDEAQNSTSSAMKSFLTRIGHNSKMVIMGDIKQTDRKGVTGLQDGMERLKGLPKVSSFEFTNDDIVRHDLINQILERYEIDPEK